MIVKLPFEIVPPLALKLILIDGLPMTRPGVVAVPGLEQQAKHI